MSKALFLLILHLSLHLSLSAQENISVSTGAALLRNFSPQQGFWSLGHSIQTHVHFSRTQGAYAWIEYYTEGRFENGFVAQAGPAFVQPQQIPFLATGRLTYRHFSLGWKHYLTGGYAEEKAVSVYGLAGFGFLFARVRNDLSASFDTVTYKAPVLAAGEGSLKRLTVDLGIGAEYPLSSHLFVFADARTWLPASGATSRYLHNQRRVPLPGILTAGIRVLIGSVY